MRVSADFIVREVAGEIMLIPVNEMSARYNGLITMNEVSKTLWDRLNQGSTQAELIRALCDEYEVSEERAADDIAMFLQKLREMGILIED